MHHSIYPRLNQNEKRNDESPANTRPSGVEAQLQECFLHERREIFLWSQVDDNSARHVVERLIYLNEIDPQADITLMINSPGGANNAGFAILDTMRTISADVRTVCMGLAASFGALLLMCGEPGKRFVFPHARVMIHQPWLPGEYRATASDLRIQAEEIQKQRDEIDRLIAEVTGRPFEQVANDTDRDHWLNAEQAVAYGVVDGVLDSL